MCFIPPVKGGIFLTGQMAEGLGGGLQNLLRRFKSASDLVLY